MLDAQVGIRGDTIMLTLFHPTESTLAGFRGHANLDMRRYVYVDTNRLFQTVKWSPNGDELVLERRLRVGMSLL